MPTADDWGNWARKEKEMLPRLGRRYGMKVSKTMKEAFVDQRGGQEKLGDNQQNCSVSESWCGKNDGRNYFTSVLD